MKIYLVGGYVRDLLLKRPNTDKDYVVIGATPQDLLDKGFKQIGKSFPVFLNPKTQEEYALARTEISNGPKHQDFICDFSPTISLEQDLFRRDFTINAMAIDPKNNTLIDPYGGKDDLENKILKHISPHFAEDPLRVFRAIRFASILDFKIHPSTEELLKKMAISPDFQKLSQARIILEIEKAHKEPWAQNFWELLQDYSLTYWFPVLKCSLDFLIPPPSSSLSWKARLLLSSFLANSPLEFQQFCAPNEKWKQTGIFSYFLYRLCHPNSYSTESSFLYGKDHRIYLPSWKDKIDPSLLLELVSFWEKGSFFLNKLEKIHTIYQKRKKEFKETFQENIFWKEQFSNFLGTNN